MDRATESFSDFEIAWRGAMTKEWLIVGGGIHGVHLAARLIGEVGIEPSRLAIVDPGQDCWLVGVPVQKRPACDICARRQFTISI